MKTLTILAACAVLLGYPSAATAQTPKDKINTAYAGQCYDFLTPDWSSYYNSMTPDFKAHLSDGTVQTRAQNVAVMKNYGHLLKFTGCDPQIQSVGVSGKRFATTVLLKLSAVALASFGKIKKGDRIEFDVLGIDTWIDPGDGKLMLAASTGKASRTVVNGKTIAHQGTM
jgi:hypothetical protein